MSFGSRITAIGSPSNDQFPDTSFVFTYQFLYVITVNEQWYMLAQSYGNGIHCIGSVLG